MKRLVETYYRLIFEDKEQDSDVPYSNKLFMFWFSLLSFLIVLFFIIKDIIKNIEAVNA